MVVLTLLLAKAAYDRYCADKDSDNEHSNENSSGSCNSYNVSDIRSNFGASFGCGSGRDVRDTERIIDNRINFDTPTSSIGYTGYRREDSFRRTSSYQRDKPHQKHQKHQKHKKSERMSRTPSISHSSPSNNPLPSTKSGRSAVSSTKSSQSNQSNQSGNSGKSGVTASTARMSSFSSTSQRSQRSQRSQLSGANSRGSQRRRRKSSRKGEYVLDETNGLLTLPPESLGSSADLDGHERLKSHMTGALDSTVDMDEHDAELTNDTTFRSDVRNDWVDAVFGKDFFPIQNTSSGAIHSNKVDIGVRQGVGLSGIEHYVTYGTILDPNKCQNPKYASSQTDSRFTPSKKLSQYTQSTPMVFASPSSMSMVGSGIEGSTSFTSCTPNAAFDSCVVSTPGAVSGVADKGYTPATAHSNRSYPVGSTLGSNDSTTPKIGATISRIPLGLYVRSISIDSEAYAAGISPGSILLDINGMGMLGETSHRALERLWRYDGTFGGSASSSGGKTIIEKDGFSAECGSCEVPTTGSSDSDAMVGKNGSSSNGSLCAGNAADLCVKKPVLLRLYKRGQVYTALLISGKPLSGIEWAPCGNFALVQRSSGLAAEAGVRRGCLVVGVDQEGLRTLDHVGVAAKLKEKFRKREMTTISLGYTPAASRSGFLERDMPTQTAMRTSSSSSNISAESRRRFTGDVEVRSRPVEYSTAVAETFFACTGPSAMDAVMDGDGPSSMDKSYHSSPNLTTGSGNSNVGSINNLSLLVADVAAYVAAGGILPPGGVMGAVSQISAMIEDGRRRPLGNDKGNNLANGSKIFTPCPPMEPQCILPKWDPLGSLVRSMSYHAAGCCEMTYVEMGGPFRNWDNGRIEASNGEAPRSNLDCLNAIKGIATSSPPGVAEEVFDAHLMELLGVATSPMLASYNIHSSSSGSKQMNDPNTESAHLENCLSAKLFDILVDVALNDVNICQRLYFLLRSFIGVLEEQKSPLGNPEESIVALKLLRYAQRRLSGRLFDKSASTELERHCSEGYPISRESSSSSRMTQSYSHLTISASESSLVDEQSSSPPFDKQRDYPIQEITTRSSIHKSEDADASQTMTESMSEENPSSCQSPLSHGSSHDYELNPISSEEASKKKKSKSKKILKLLKGGKSKLSLKKGDDKALPPHGNPPRKKSPNKRSPNKGMKYEGSFSFSNVFSKAASAPTLQTIDCVPPDVPQIIPNDSLSLTSQSMSRKFENMAWILRQIDNQVSVIEKNLIKSFPQKMADLALYPWSASKENALASIIQGLRSELRLMNSVGCSPDLASETRFPLLNPVDSTELFTSVDPEECFILPSAHFPLLLCFNARPTLESSTLQTDSRKKKKHLTNHKDALYRTRVELLELRNAIHSGRKPKGGADGFVVQCAIGGAVQESGMSVTCLGSQDQNLSDSSSHRWTSGHTMAFETRTNWGFPKTLSLKVAGSMRGNEKKDDLNTSMCDDKKLSDIGCGFVDLCPIWNKVKNGPDTISVRDSTIEVFLFQNAQEFDQHGEVDEQYPDKSQGLELHLRVTTEIVPVRDHIQKRHLLYKHGDDLRQELLAIQFIERCSQILKSSGLDLKLKTFRCLPVGAQKGFIEWVTGTVPLSEICQSFGSSFSGSTTGSRQSSWSKEGYTDSETLDSTSAPTETLDQTNDAKSQRRSWCKYQSLRGLRQKMNGSHVENPIQDFLRSSAYDEDAPYFVKKEVMDAYVKSCAGYCVITYLLGVGDRHLDNILLHQNGHLIHCDYSFILGHDPKTYLPMRITEEMIRGFGGRESDNFAKFLSCTGAAFLTLRRHNNLHALLSHIRNLIHANMRDVSVSQPPEEAILAMRGRFRLDLNDSDALTYIEHVVEKSITSKMWKAVDVMHSLGKHF